MGCVKTRLSRGRAELFSQLPSASSTTSAIGIRNDEIEMEILRASSASEFSHSLGQSRHFDGLPMTSGLPPEADIVTAGRHCDEVFGRAIFRYRYSNRMRS
jgi:hypothetical protein